MSARQFAVFIETTGRSGVAYSNVLLTDGCMTDPNNCRGARVAADVRDFGRPLMQPKLFASSKAAWRHVAQTREPAYYRGVTVRLWKDAP